MSDENIHFIHEIIEGDLASGKHAAVVTRFPPEPNGYLHIGHAKAICINFGIAEKYRSHCNMRFDDTNPAAEEQEFVDAILDNIRWLGFDWGDHLYFASSYFQQMYELALRLIEEGLAYVCDLTPEEFKVVRGVPTEPGGESRNRNRSVEENLRLFKEMKDGVHGDGSMVLRAKIDMRSPNLHLRDPAMYRVKRARHHRTGDEWSIYPMYDWAHGLEDAIEGVTHSLCSLEFEVHRPLYNWFLEKLNWPEPRPQQVEFARLNLTYTVLSKRKLQLLVSEGHVEGWDDPRMPTLAGLRRRGVPAAAIVGLCDKVGVTKANSLTDVSLLDHGIREALNKTAPRRMAVLKPLKVVVENFAEGEERFCLAVNNPEDEGAGKRELPFSRVLYIDRDDFMEDPPRKFFRLGLGREVRLKYACYITCTEVVKDDAGEVVELRCSWDPESWGASTPDGRRVKGTIQWVSAAHAKEVGLRLVDRLFAVEDPEGDREVDFLSHLHPDSLVEQVALVEPSLAEEAPGFSCQFERVGYFCVDPERDEAGRLRYNRTINMRDSWARIAKKG